MTTQNPIAGPGKQLPADEELIGRFRHWKSHPALPDMLRSPSYVWIDRARRKKGKIQKWYDFARETESNGDWFFFFNDS